MFVERGSTSSIAQLQRLMKHKSVNRLNQPPHPTPWAGWYQEKESLFGRQGSLNNVETHTELYTSVCVLFFAVLLCFVLAPTIDMSRSNECATMLRY